MDHTLKENMLLIFFNFMLCLFKSFIENMKLLEEVF